MGSVARCLWLLPGLVSAWLAGCSGETVNIGYIGGMSGRLSELGLSGRTAVEFILAEESGRLAPGIRFQLLVADDSNTADGGAGAVRRLVDKGCHLLIGPMTTAAAEGAVPAARRAGILLLSPTVAGIQRQGPSDWFFPIMAGAWTMGRAAGQWCREDGHTRVVALLDSANVTYASQVLDGFASAAGDGVLVSQIMFSSANVKGQHGQYAEKVLSLRPTALLIVASGMDTALVCQALFKAGSTLALYSPSWALTRELAEHGGMGAERIRAVSCWDDNNPRTDWIRFAERYKKLYGRSPGFSETQAADAMRLALMAVAKSPEKTRSRIRQAAETVAAGFKGIQSDILLDEGGMPLREVFRVTLRSGRFVRVYP